MRYVECRMYVVELGIEDNTQHTYMCMFADSFDKSVADVYYGGDEIVPKRRGKSKLGKKLKTTQQDTFFGEKARKRRLKVCLY